MGREYQRTLRRYEFLAEFWECLYEGILLDIYWLRRDSSFGNGLLLVLQTRSLDTEHITDLRDSLMTGVYIRALSES